MLMIIFLYLLLFSYQDLKSYTISSKLIIPLIWFAGVHRELDQLWIGLPIYLILLHLNKSEKYIGNGDLDLFFI
ncbi:hypothetical protein G7084_06830 [Weissella coleopterorum]|uniref:Prepilin type IV endopeptidase peptidase domain-containing protein n=1 Tax=Weissella coleopterorum TaxID=2714949 RepID=A0A6G8B1B1_9LACO|nr:prepilin peptidase [Weissella coleopterorum]QIL51036.1 hypothetical protein G7084_06830 [Weissella coleopterorum]